MVCVDEAQNTPVSGKRIDAAHLDEAAAAGEAYKREYYADRLEAASSRYWVYRDLALAAERNGGVLSWDGIHSLTGKVRDGTGESMEDFLTDACLIKDYIHTQGLR